jgi:hypothetical protein
MKNGKFEEKKMKKKEKKYLNVCDRFQKNWPQKIL